MRPSIVVSAYPCFFRVQAYSRIFVVLAWLVARCSCCFVAPASPLLDGFSTGSDVFAALPAVGALHGVSSLHWQYLSKILGEFKINV